MRAKDPEFHIVLIDDSRADAKIIERAFREGEVAHRLTVFADGQLALDYLFDLRDDSGPSQHLPNLILLDLNLPGLDGCQILTRIKADPYLKVIPVVILTTSDREEDILQTYQAGANTYLRKPPEYALYRDLVATLRAYWIETALKAPFHLIRKPTRASRES
jgi:CheY-like chemotaxis protein